MLAVLACAQQEIIRLLTLERDVLCHGDKGSAGEAPTVIHNRLLLQIFHLSYTPFIVLINTRVYYGFSLGVPRDTIHLCLSVLCQLHILQRLASHEVADHELAEAVEVGWRALADASKCGTVVHESQVAYNLSLVVASRLTNGGASLLIGRHRLQVRHVWEVRHVHLIERVRTEQELVRWCQHERRARLLMTIQQLRLIVEGISCRIVLTRSLLGVLRQLR